MKLTHYLSILALAAIFASCGKGDTGPQGPQGDPGTNGVANIYTRIYDVSLWSYAGSNNWISTSQESDITDNNNDAVEVYWNTSLNSGWLSMPAASIFVPQDQLEYGFTDNSVTFTYYNNGSGNSPSNYYSDIYFKVTVIPPSVQHKYPNTNWQNASEVQKIPEVQAALNNNK